ncbi:hypothetical protein PIB30_058289 [Stylosanthes scabra]|uniref:Uncharacterized protein n=1 Tax=Stylosanthes scabra TaxID=79078 RepID=A0ABU6YI43_9FABA|nr:hypothetical protein [Stylosanthes scabra]
MSLDVENEGKKEQPSSPKLARIDSDPIKVDSHVMKNENEKTLSATSRLEPCRVEQRQKERAKVVVELILLSLELTFPTSSGFFDEVHSSESTPMESTRTDQHVLETCLTTQILF